MKLFLVVIVVLSAAIYPSYILAGQYRLQRFSQIQKADVGVLSQLDKRNTALTILTLSQKNVFDLSKENISTESATIVLNSIRASFAKGDYDSVGTLSAQLTSGIVKARADDKNLYDDFSHKIVELGEKRDAYKKQGVTVATISAGIASASASLLGKDYLVLPSLLTLLDDSLTSLLVQKKEADRKAALAAAAAIAAPVAPQSVGGITYERKTIGTSVGSFSVDILTVDLNRVKAKTFTASDSDCVTNCPLKPLASYVLENGGIAGINGSYFCPADYSSCSSKVNAFDLLVFDYRSKHYANSAQNQYRVNPLISFYPDGAHYYTQALGFGRDTSAYGAISNFPTLIHNGGISVNGGLDAKSAGTKTFRGGIGFRGKTLWTVMTRGATVPDTAYVFQALGAQYAMNLDGGGSAALYFGGYKVGPGRNLPNAVVFTP